MSNDPYWQRQLRINQGLSDSARANEARWTQQARVNDATVQIAGRVREHDGQIAGIGTTIRGIFDRLNPLETRVTGHGERLDTHDERLDAHATIAMDQSERIIELQNFREAANRRLLEIEGRIEEDNWPIVVMLVVALISLIWPIWPNYVNIDTPANVHVFPSDGFRILFAFIGALGIGGLAAFFYSVLRKPALRMRAQVEERRIDRTNERIRVAEQRRQASAAAGATQTTTTTQVQPATPVRPNGVY